MGHILTKCPNINFAIKTICKNSASAEFFLDMLPIRFSFNRFFLFPLHIWD